MWFLTRYPPIRCRDVVSNSLSSNQVSRQIKQLRVVLESAQAKEREREWLGNQNTGELDDAKLVVCVWGGILPASPCVTILCLSSCLAPTSSLVVLTAEIAYRVNSIIIKRPSLPTEVYQSIVFISMYSSDV